MIIPPANLTQNSRISVPPDFPGSRRPLDFFLFSLVSFQFLRFFLRLALTFLLLFMLLKTPFRAKTFLISVGLRNMEGLVTALTR